ncbi:hypothetical protein COL940_010629 [Colletotrichum noveboracense]|nr:hypothetical protein COL940_010629 [Colletotrichum noveboracense]KAJ0278024.1 hypothetical protein CBS470a_009994 [Colletotrichum nupharicola]
MRFLLLTVILTIQLLLGCLAHPALRDSHASSVIERSDTDSIVRRGWGFKNPFKGKSKGTSSSQPQQDVESESDNEEQTAAADLSDTEDGHVPDITKRGYIFNAHKYSDSVRVDVGVMMPSPQEWKPDMFFSLDDMTVYPSRNEIKIWNAINEDDPTLEPRKCRFRTIIMATWKEYSNKYVSELEYVTFASITNEDTLESIKQAYLWMERSQDDGEPNELRVDKAEEGTDERKAFNWLVNQNPLGRAVRGIPSTFSAMEDKEIDRVDVWTDNRARYVRYRLR